MTTAQDILRDTIGDLVIWNAQLQERLAAKEEELRMLQEAWDSWHTQNPEENRDERS